jgi:hypothetical protein
VSRRRSCIPDANQAFRGLAHFTSHDNRARGYAMLMQACFRLFLRKARSTFARPLEMR